MRSATIRAPSQSPRARNKTETTRPAGNSHQFQALRMGLFVGPARGGATVVAGGGTVRGGAGDTGAASVMARYGPSGDAASRAAGVAPRASPVAPRPHSVSNTRSSTARMASFEA